MDGLEEPKSTFMKSGNNVRWGTLILAFVGLIVISYGFVYLLQFIDLSEFPLYDYALAAYLAVFLSSLIANLTIIAPVPFALVIVITAATKFNPWIIALCAATGGTIGEMSGYYAGRLGKKIAIPDSIVAYHKIEGWINKYGFWAIMLLAFQPIIPFDIGGLVAGTAKMPLFYFLPALWLGKFPKYLLFAFAGVGAINFLPGWLLP
ncbi:MAG: VTT domain-containing protein [Dehalococcoidales bacterium]|nr:VTT domain-containing protein [Dehalococcoidales bacterium]